jgi:hypothetical protein
MFTEEIKITADKLADTVKDLIHEGNVRHIVIKNGDGVTLLEVPVTVGLVGLLVAPAIAAIAAIAVFAADFTILVTRDKVVQPVAPAEAVDEPTI